MSTSATPLSFRLKVWASVPFFAIACTLSAHGQTAGTNAPKPASASPVKVTPAVSESESPAVSEPESPAVTESTATVAPAVSTDSPSAGVRFSFEGTSWRAVLSWLADEAGLALHVGELPSGSFTYSDTELFSPDDAIDRVNLFLIPQGFTVVRRGRLLSVISLTDPRSIQQLDAMAELVSVDDLATLNSYDVVKCIFPLQRAQPDDASEELRSLTLMTQPVVLPSSRQLMITETVGKLRSVQKILSALDQPRVEDSVVQRFQLQHVTMDAVMEVARTHLGLEGEETAGMDINVSSLNEGKTLFVTGSEAKVQLLSSLIDIVDVADPNATPETVAVLRSHAIQGNNLKTVYEVLQTLLVGKSLRLSMEIETNSIVALADVETHQQIEATISELEAPAVEFAVIDLGDIDPYFAITLIGELFDLPTEYDEDEESVSSLKVDADPENRRLFVRGKSSQIQQIRDMVAGLGGAGPPRDVTRIVPVHGERATELLRSAEEFWRGENPVQVLPTVRAEQGGFIERAIHPEGVQPEVAHSGGLQTRSASSRVESATAPRQSADARHSDANPFDEPLATTISSGTRFASTAAADVSENSNTSRSAASPIQGQVTPEGIVLQSTDPAALNQFEQHLRSVAGSGTAATVQPIVYYLKYARAEEATRMLAELVDGAMTISGSPSGSLVNGYVSSPTDSSIFGSYVSNQGGTTSMTVGTASVLADARLNRLIVQGSAQEVALIEKYLQIIDKDSSLTDVETYGGSHVIELQNTKAAEVAELIREAFAGRLADAKSGAAQPADAKAQAAAKAAAAKAAKSTDKLKTTASSAQTAEPKMTVAVHEQSNSLVVTAPDYLFAQVEKLAQLVDRRGEQTVEVIVPANAEYIQSVLEEVLLGGESSSSKTKTKR